MKYICQLDAPAGPRSVGGKAYNLSLLAASGLKVPRGFVLTASAFEEALGGELKQLRDAASPAAVKGLLPRLRDNVLAAVLPAAPARELRAACALLDAPLAAVRSSAEAEDGARDSFAGQFESFLGIAADGRESAVIRCWASAFNPRAHTYRPGATPRMAVIVQEMVEAEVSGVAFSCDPVTGDRGVVVIEAVYGLCEPLVSGAMTPDHYRMTRERLEVEQSAVAAQGEYLGVRTGGGTALFPVPEELRALPKLSGEMLREIARAALSIEALLEGPVDIEWAVKDGELHILQARRVTGLAEHI